MPLPQDLFRVTNVEYEVAEVQPTNAYSTQHAIVLPHDLARDYLVMLDYANAPGQTQRPDQMAFRVIADPFGTGDLEVSGSSRTLIVENGVAVNRAPRLHITIIECLNPYSPDGFALRDVVTVFHDAPTTSGSHAVSKTVSLNGEVDATRCTVHGITRGFGHMATGSGTYIPNVGWAAEYLSSGTELTIKRFSPFGSAGGESVGFHSTHGIVEWGSNWTVYLDNGVDFCGGNGSVVTSGQQIMPVDEYIPSQTILFPTYSAQHGVDDIYFNSVMWIPYGSSVIHSGGTATIPQDAPQTGVAICTWTNGVQIEYALQMVSHPDMHVEHTLALVNDTLRDEDNADTISVDGPLNGSESTSVGVMGADIQIGERALMYTIQGEAQNTTDDNASLIVGLHFQDDSTVAFHGVDDNNAGAAVDVLLSIADFGGFAVSEPLSNNDGTVGQYFIFPNPHADLQIGSVTSESGLKAGVAQPQDTNNGSINLRQIGTPSASLATNVKITKSGRVGESEFVWREQGDTEYIGKSHDTHKWGSRAIMTGLNDVHSITSAFCESENKMYYAGVSDTGRADSEIEVFSRAEGSAVNDEPVAHQTITLDPPNIITPGQEQTIECALVDTSNGDMLLVVLRSWPQTIGFSTTIVSRIELWKKEKGLVENFSLISKDITEGLFNSENFSQGHTSIRAARSGRYIKVIMGGMETTPSDTYASSVTSSNNGMSWRYQRENGLKNAGFDPFTVDSGVLPLRNFDTMIHDIVGIPTSSGEFYYVFQSLDGTDFPLYLARGSGFGLFAPLSRTKVDTNKSPVDIAACYDNGKIKVIGYNICTASGREDSHFYTCSYDLNDLSNPDSKITFDIDESGSIPFGRGSFHIGGLHMTPAFGRTECIYFTMTHNGAGSGNLDPSSTNHVCQFMLGGWSTVQITQTDALALSRVNPLSHISYAAVDGIPSSTSSYIGTTQFSSSGSGTVSLNQNGYLLIGATTMSSRSFTFVSESTASISSFKQGMACGWTFEPSSGTFRFDIQIEETSGLTDGALIRFEANSSNWILQSGDNSSVYTTHYTDSSGLNAGDAYQCVLAYNGDGQVRVYIRNLSEGDEHKSWVDSGTINIGNSNAPINDSITFGSVAGGISSNIRLYEVWCTVMEENCQSAWYSNDLNIYENEDLGPKTSGTLTYIDKGLSFSFNGGFGQVNDVINTETDADYPVENIVKNSPRFSWRSSNDSVENIIELSAGAIGLRETVHDGIAMFGTNFRQVHVEYDSSSSFSAPTVKTLYADVTGTLTVESVSNDTIELSGHTMTRGEFKDYSVFVLTGSQAGKSFPIRNHPDKDKLQLINGSHGIVATDTLVVYGDRFAKLYTDPVSALYWRIRIPAQDTFTDNYFEIGTVVAGPAFKPGDVPLDWSISASDNPNIGRLESDSGVVWAFRKGPARRSISANFIGDANRQRDSFRAMVNKLSEYGIRPFVTVLDGSMETDMCMLNVCEPLSLESAAWYLDEGNRWRLAGDMGITLTEVV